MSKTANKEVRPNPDAEEIESLHKKLDLMGIKYHHKAGAEKLRALVASTIEEAVVPVKQEVPDYMPEDSIGLVETKGAKAVRLRREASALVRVIVSCMNPEKREWEGETFSVGNSVVGQYKKYVPFNNEAGYHVPQIILNHLLEKECQIWVNKKNAQGEKVKVGRLIKELNVQVLSPLTLEELRSLGQEQSRSHRLD